MERKGIRFGYARVSSTGQNLDRQLIQLRRLGIDERHIITDKKSGIDMDRPGYQSLKSATGLRPGDTLVITALDRLGRNKGQVKEELEYWKANGVRVQIVNIPMTMREPDKGQEWVIEMVNNIIIEVMASIAQQEWEEMHIRQSQGIAAARAAGKHLGRRAIEYPANWEAVYTAWKNKETTAKAAYQTLGLRVNTFYRMVKRWEAAKGEGK